MIVCLCVGGQGVGVGSKTQYWDCISWGFGSCYHSIKMMLKTIKNKDKYEQKREICNLANMREGKFKDLGNKNCIKNENTRIMVKQGILNIDGGHILKTY